MLDLLRICTLSLCFIYIGFNISLYKHNTNPDSDIIIIGRILVVAGIATGVFLRLISLNDAAPYFSNVLVIVGLSTSTVGLYRRYGLHNSKRSDV